MGILLLHASSIRPCRTCNRATTYECRCGPEAAARGGPDTSYRPVLPAALWLKCRLRADLMPGPAAV
ncbi:hypothetical protein FJD01_21950 [Escherichia coli]|nr:hypothetical protein [Escherichia coli]